MSFRISLVVIILSASQLHAQSNGVTLVGHLDVPHGTSGQGTHYSSCWGYVAPDGKEYAMIGCYTGTSIIDMNSDSLREIAFIPGPPASYCYRAYKTYKQYAYIVSEGVVLVDSTYSGVGVQIVDMSHLPDSAVLLKQFIYKDSLTGKRTDRAHTLSFADGVLYLNGGSWNGCVFFSLKEDPTTPTYVGHYDPTYLHDTYIHNDTLYGAAIYGAGLYIADVKDKANPIEIGHVTYNGSGTHNAWASIDGKYAFTTDEIGTTTHDLKIWALDSLPNSVKVGEYQAEPTSNIHNIYGRGQYAYIAHYTAGMRVVDIHDKNNPAEVGYYDTYPGASGGYAGCWDVYPYFPSGRWIGSDMQTGLYVCTFDSLKPRVRSRLLEPQDNSYGPGYYFSWTLATNQSEDPHYYEMHLIGPGTERIYKTTDTSLVLGIPDSLEVAGTYTWYVLIKDEFTEVVSQDTFHFTVAPTGVNEKPEQPFSFSLKQNYPNPFNPQTKIEFTLPKTTNVTLRIYDLLGKEVLTLLNNQPFSPGKHEAVFDASRLSSGIYFYRLISPVFSDTRRMVLTK